MVVSLNVGLFRDFAISLSCRSDIVLTFEELVSNRICTSIKGLSCHRNESPRVRAGVRVKDLVISSELLISEKLGFPQEPPQVLPALTCIHFRRGEFDRG